MPRARKTTKSGITNPVPFGMSNKQMKRKKPINLEYLNNIEPLTDNQEIMFDEYAKGKNIFAYGAAGTGKTFVALYLALKEVLDERSPYEKIYIVRSLVATREIGFLPGDHEDKSSLYQIPYKNMVKYMFKMPDENSFEMLYGNLKNQGTVSFWSTSFIRGTTFDNAILIIDECQNLNFHELDSIITRVGENTKIMFCGDVVQSDLIKQHERNGIVDFLKILQQMDEFSLIEFGLDDIVRSGLVKSYLVAKHNLGM
jgi:predicted ribonuclease YlaK